MNYYEFAGRLAALRRESLRAPGNRPRGSARGRDSRLDRVFEDLRPYQPGDPTRFIDWKTAARSERIFVRTARPPRGEQIVLWLDFSPSMGMGTNGGLSEKWQTARLFTLGLAWILWKEGNPVVVAGRGAGGAQRLRREEQLADWFSAWELNPLGAGYAGKQNHTDAEGLPDIRQECEAQGARPDKSLLIPVSDFLFPEEALARDLRPMVVSWGRVWPVQVAERKPANPGRAILQIVDLETGRRREIDRREWQTYWDGLREWERRRSQLLARLCGGRSFLLSRDNSVWSLLSVFRGQLERRL